MVRAFFLLMLCLVPLNDSSAYLADDFNDTRNERRIVVGGDLVPTPAGSGKPWDGGSGWLSGMRHGISHAKFFGRTDCVLYPDIRPGADIPIEQGTLELWVQRRRALANEMDRDTLLQFVDRDGRSLITIAIVYPGGTLAPSLIVGETDDVWGPVILMPSMQVGEWLHLAFTWGPRGAIDNRVYRNGHALPPIPGSGQGNFAEVVKRTATVKIGTGYEDDDPAYHSLIDEFRFSPQIKTSFDLSRSLALQP